MYDVTFTIRVDASTLDTSVSAAMPELSNKAQRDCGLAACTFFMAKCKQLFGDEFVDEVMEQLGHTAEDKDGGSERALPGGQEQPCPVQRTEHNDG